MERIKDRYCVSVYFCWGFFLPAQKYPVVVLLAQQTSDPSLGAGLSSGEEYKFHNASPQFEQLVATTQVNNSQILLYVHRNYKDCQGRGAQDGHLDFHTAPELWSETDVNPV